MPEPTIVKTLPGAISITTGFKSLSTYGILDNTDELTPYLDALVAASLSIPNAKISALDTFLNTLKSVNILDNILYIAPIWGETDSQSQIVLKNGLNSSNITTVSNQPFTGYDQFEGDGTYNLGFVGVSGRPIGASNLFGQSQFLGFQWGDLYVKASGFQNQNSRAVGFTIVGDAGYTKEAEYPTEHGSLTNDIIGYSELDSGKTNTALINMDDFGQVGNNLFGTSTTPGQYQLAPNWTSGHRFQRAAHSGAAKISMSATLGGSVTKAEAAHTPAAMPRDGTNVLVMGKYAYSSNSIAEGSPSQHFTNERIKRIRFLMIDDGSVNETDVWTTVNAAVNTLLTALGKNTW